MSKVFCFGILLVVCVLVFSDVDAKGYGGGGHSSSHYDHHGPAYKFGYDISDKYGSHGRKESDDGHGSRHGSYFLHDKDGRKRMVEYVADKKGFRAKIHSNEPGLASHHAAHAKYDVEHHGYHGGHDDGGHGGGHYDGEEY